MLKPRVSKILTIPVEKEQNMSFTDNIKMHLVTLTKTQLWDLGVGTLGGHPSINWLKWTNFNPMKKRHLEDGLILLVRPSSGGGGGVSGTFSYLRIL